jgi:hypothetical protein
MLRLASLALVSITLFACGSDADDLGIGAQCSADDQCNTDLMQTCVLNFKGGYCGKKGCTTEADCPDLSSCVAHTDGMNYCFRNCIDKAECNENRDAENESNCSANITFVVPADNVGLKACVPPSA